MNIFRKIVFVSLLIIIGLFIIHIINLTTTNLDTTNKFHKQLNLTLTELKKDNNTYLIGTYGDSYLIISKDNLRADNVTFYNTNNKFTKFYLIKNIIISDINISKNYINIVSEKTEYRFKIYKAPEPLLLF